MERILITGASGNVGQAIIRYFVPNHTQRLFLATREKKPTDPDQLYFNFDDIEATKQTLQKVDILFLLRPPHISEVQTYFEPLIKNAETAGVKHIVFLSVQGADEVSFIPHAKIEKLILESGLAYTFIRPSYFMQNLTTTLLEDIRKKDQIFLPAGKARFLWVDVADIGKAIAAILKDVKAHQNKTCTITGHELYHFREVAEMLTKTLGRKIQYISPNLLKFYFTKKKEGVKPAFIFVMIMLHFLPRFQKPPIISNDFTLLTGDKPNTLYEFISENLELWK